MQRREPFKAYTGADELAGDQFVSSRGQAHIRDTPNQYGPRAYCGNLSNVPAVFRKTGRNVHAYCVPCQDAYAKKNEGRSAHSATDDLED